MPEISVVIPTRNRLETLRHVIPSLLAQDLAPDRYEIIVADSQSTDGTAEYLREQAASHPSLRHLPGPYTGRAMARNAGIAAGSAPLVLFTDADIIASPDLLRRHLERHAAAAPGDRAAAGGGAARSGWRSVQLAAARAARSVAVVGLELQVSSLDDYIAQRDHPELRRPLHPPSRRRLSWLYFLTGNASVRRADLDRVSRFDEDFTGYGHEDLELGYRLAAAGLPILYEPRAVNYHWHPVPYAEQKGRMELAGRSTVRFHRKHPSFEVQLKLGMTPLSRGAHALLSHAPWLMERLERSADAHPGFARSLVYQYHYVSGIKAALREAAPVGE